MDARAQIIAFIASYFVSLVNGYLRNAKWFTWVQPENKQAAQALVSVLSAFTAIVVVLVSGKQLDSNLAVTFLNGVADFVMVLGGSALFHHWILKKPVIES